jgi:hypothetical protein
VPATRCGWALPQPPSVDITRTFFIEGSAWMRPRWGLKEKVTTKKIAQENTEEQQGSVPESFPRVSIAHAANSQLSTLNQSRHIFLFTQPKK